MKYGNMIKKSIRIVRKEGILKFKHRALSYLGLSWLRIVFHNILIQLSSIIQRDDRIWIFGTPHGFDQNSKYLYLYIVSNIENVRPIWISKRLETVKKLNEAGYEAYYSYSWAGVYYLLKSRYVFFTNSKRDIGVWGFTGGAESINLWHGNQIKEFRINKNWSKNMERKADYHVVTSSETALDLYAEMPWIDSSKPEFKQNKAIITGYPRNDILFHDIPDSEIGVDSDLLSQIKSLNKRNTVLIYLPTWRPYGEENPLFQEDNLTRIDEYLAEENCKLLIKHHPSRALEVQDQKFDNIIIIRSKTDIYPIIKNSDVLITDYSSIYFDYLLLDQPIILFTYDENKYRSELGFHYDVSKLPSGQARDLDELIHLINESINKRDTYERDRHEIREEFYVGQNELSCKRIVEELQ